MATRTSGLERQLKLALFVREHGPVSRQAICEALSEYEATSASEASIRRKFERDKQELEELGIVLSLDEQDRYTLDSHASFAAPLELSASQVSMLRTACALLLEDEAYPLKDELRMVLIKLGTELETPDCLPTEALNAESNLAIAGTLRKVRAALAKRKRLEFDYEDSQGRLSRRDTEPCGSFLLKSNCYLVAYDRQRQDMRTFRLDRMSRLHMNSKAAGTPDFEERPFDPAQWCKPPYQLGKIQGTALVRFPNGAAAELEFASASDLARWCIEEGARPLGPASVVKAHGSLLKASALAQKRIEECDDAKALAALGRRKGPSGRAGARDLLVPLFTLIEQNGIVSIPQAAGLLGCSEDEAYEALEQLVFCYDSAASLRLELGERGCAFARLNGSSGQTLRMTVPELSVLYDALLACGFEGENALMQAVTAAKGSLGAENETAASDHVHAATSLSSAEVFATLAQACEPESQAVLGIVFTPVGSRTAETRRVEPQRLFARNGRRYLQAWCHQSQDVRSFRLDRISKAEVLPDHPTGHKVEKASSEDAPRAIVCMEASTCPPAWSGLSAPKRLASGLHAYSLPWYGSAWLPRQIAAQGGCIWAVAPQSLVEATQKVCQG